MITNVILTDILLMPVWSLDSVGSQMLYRGLASQLLCLSIQVQVQCLFKLLLVNLRRVVFTCELCEMFLCRGIQSQSPHPLLHFSPPKHKCGAGFSLAWANIRGALGPLPTLQTPPGITRMPKPCVGCMFSLNKWQDVQAGNGMQSDDPGGTQRLLQYDEDASLFQCFLGLKTLRLNTELLLIAIDKMWQDNLVPGGILGLISVWYMFCLLQFLAGNPKWMCAAKKTDGLVAGGLLDSRRWFEWGVDTHESPAAGIWQTLRDTERKNRRVPTGWEVLQKAASFCLTVPQKKLQHIGHCY